MPLRALQHGTPIQAFNFNAAQWAQLKAEHKTLGLTIPCCGAVAIPKTSPLGTNFFAHARKGDCTTAPESAEHLFCKQLVAQAAQDAGWQVTTEQPGAAEAGEEWVADVYCVKGKAQVALEIQMSPQSIEELERRHARYAASGVRAAWFLGPKAHQGLIPFNQKTPVFGLPTILVGTIPQVERFQVGLDAFVKALLTKRLRWETPLEEVNLTVAVIPDICWACKQPVKQLYGHISDADLDWDGEGFDRYHTPAMLSKELERLSALVTNEELYDAGLNIVGQQPVIRNKLTAYPFCNLCRHCRAPQNNYHVGQKVLEREAARASMPDPEALLRDPYGGEDPGNFVVDFPRLAQGEGRWMLADSA